MAKYFYKYQDERGQFEAYVSDSEGNTVWQVSYPDYYEDELTGELVEGSTIFEDGFMRSTDDIQGLEKYLKQMGVIQWDDELTMDEMEEDNDEYSKGGGVHDLSKVVVYDNNGETLDRYTVFTPDGAVYGMSETAAGFNQYVGDSSEIQKGSHLGKRLKSVPEGIKWAVAARIKEEYANGGEIADEIKTKLTKAAAASENGMALPYEIAVYVPSTQDANKIVNRKEFQRRIDEVQKYLAELFGGFSANDVDGGYTSTEKEVIQEDIYRVVSFATKEAAKSKFPQLIDQLSIWAGKWGQEAIGLEFEGDMFYVDKKTKLKRGGTLGAGSFGHGGYMAKGGGTEKPMSYYRYETPKVTIYWKGKLQPLGKFKSAEEAYEVIKKQSNMYGGIENYEIHTPDKIIKMEEGGTLGAGSFESGGATKRKSGNEPKVQRKVDELNRLIKLANENDIEITDNTSTWEAPMRYKPIKYTNGTLYLEWEELDLYKANRGEGRKYEKKTDKVLKSDMELDGIPTLNFLARRYRNALKNAGIQF